MGMRFWFSIVDAIKTGVVLVCADAAAFRLVVKLHVCLATNDNGNNIHRQPVKANAIIRLIGQSLGKAEKNAFLNHTFFICGRFGD